MGMFPTTGRMVSEAAAPVKKTVTLLIFCVVLFSHSAAGFANEWWLCDPHALLYLLAGDYQRCRPSSILG